MKLGNLACVLVFLLIGITVPTAALVAADRSCTWNPGVMISDGTGGWYDPDIAVEGTNVHVVWEYDAVTLLKYRRSTNSGASWDAIQTLAGGNVSKPHVAVSGSFVHIVWRGHEGEVGTILYRRSMDGGVTFGSNVTIGTGDYRGYEPDISASGSNVYITWLRRSPDYDVLFRLVLQAMEPGFTLSGVKSGPRECMVTATGVRIMEAHGIHRHRISPGLSAILPWRPMDHPSITTETKAIRLKVQLRKSAATMVAPGPVSYTLATVTIEDRKSA